MPLSQGNRMQMAISANKYKRISQIEKLLAYLGSPIQPLKSRSETGVNGYRLINIKGVLAKRRLDADKRGFSIQPKFLREMA
jgi:hypothetical protein